MLRNVVAVVSGGSSGLGAATTSQIISHGGRVLVADLESSKDNYLKLAASVCAPLRKTDSAMESSCEAYYPHRPESVTPKSGGISNEGELLHTGPVIAFAPTNVTEESEVQQALDDTEERFGEPVNVAVNCAGYALSRRLISKKKALTDNDEELFIPHSLEDFNNILQVNTLGTFNVSRLAAERMLSRETDVEGMRGCIINTSSIAAFEGQVGQVAYSASKGAIVGMTLPMARDLAPFGIRVMAVAPGLFNTPLMSKLPESVKTELAKTVPLPPKLGDPNEFGKMIVSIVSNPMLNGEVIRLDGALRMGMK